MTKPLARRIALVTGASRGIGHSTALALAREGAHVVATARTVGGLEELDDTVKAAGGTATLVPLDLRDSEGIARLAAALDERYGKLDVLVGNAALGASNSPLDHFHPKEWDEVLGVNVTANWHLIRFFNPLLQKSDAGRVVFITSGSATNARPYRGLYGVSKAALDLMARTYAAEIASTPTKVNLFNPGPTRTKMRAAVMPGEDPMTLPHPDEVAAAIVPLCLPNFKESGKLYDFRARKLLSFKPPE
jgi:NAD(P)-dependent dehydrogenase (short-subunit alcohol dehydrogenase family)